MHLYTHKCNHAPHPFYYYLWLPGDHPQNLTPFSFTVLYWNCLAVTPTKFSSKKTIINKNKFKRLITFWDCVCSSTQVCSHHPSEEHSTQSTSSLFLPVSKVASGSLEIKHFCIPLPCVSLLQLWYRYNPVVSLSGALSLSTFQLISCEDIRFSWCMVAGISQVSLRINLALWHLYIEAFFLHRWESVILTELIKDYLSLE